jgi:hypothetical protein
MTPTRIIATLAIAASLAIGSGCTAVRMLGLGEEHDELAMQILIKAVEVAAVKNGLDPDVLSGDEVREIVSILASQKRLEEIAVEKAAREDVQRKASELIQLYIIQGKVPGVPLPEPTDPGAWRSDMAEVKAVDGVVTFRTRDIQHPPGATDDGGMEWIIARIEGQGYQRLLVMTMGGSRPPSRIYFQRGGVATEYNSKFPVPLPGPSQWRVEASGGQLRVMLDGAEIWSEAGDYTVDRAIMNGYSGRHFIGEWSE